LPAERDYVAYATPGTLRRETISQPVDVTSPSAAKSGRVEGSKSLRKGPRSLPPTRARGPGIGSHGGSHAHSFDTQPDR